VPAPYGATLARLRDINAQIAALRPQLAL
jgi:hypothetical protein